MAAGLRGRSGLRGAKETGGEPGGPRSRRTIALYKSSLLLMFPPGKGASVSSPPAESPCRCFSRRFSEEGTTERTGKRSSNPEGVTPPPASLSRVSPAVPACFRGSPWDIELRLCCVTPSPCSWSHWEAREESQHLNKNLWCVLTHIQGG